MIEADDAAPMPSVPRPGGSDDRRPCSLPAPSRRPGWLTRGATGAIAFFLLAGAGARAEPAPCCGPITPEGVRLAAFLDGSGVDHLWMSGWHVNWRTGAANRPEPGGREAKTHCSAYAAAMAERLGVYVLRPPQHPQELLANAQLAWLRENGPVNGWRPVATQKEAQALANRGALVLAAFESPNPRRPGHIAILHPSTKSAADLDREGPDEAQAGTRNATDVPVAVGFSGHRGAWAPGGTGGIRFYAHDVDWARLPRDVDWARLPRDVD